MKITIAEDPDLGIIEKLAKKHGVTFEHALGLALKGWVAFVDDKPVGSVCLSKFGETFVFDMPILDKEYYGTDVPKLLVKAISEEAKKRRIKTLYEPGEHADVSKEFGLVEIPPKDAPSDVLVCYRCHKYKKTCFPKLLKFDVK